MKVTIDLPEDLVRDLQRKAANERRTLEDVVAERLRSAQAETARDSGQEAVGLPKTLPMLRLRPVSPPKEQLTGQALCDWLKELDLQMEVERFEASLGHQYLDRTPR